MNAQPSPAKRLRPSGGYRTLRSFLTASVIYDGTLLFCDRFVNPRSRLRDQMLQAARSGRQNIAEGSRAAATSSQTELRLVNVARASLDELLLDYEDYLRQHNQRLWTKSDPEALAVRAVGQELAGQPESAAQAQYAKYEKWLDQEESSIVANTLICLIHQANYLLDQQISALERKFIQDGGYSEGLAAARIAERQRLQADKELKPTAPACPLCGKPLVLRTARKGPRVGSQFWGCPAFPRCKGSRPLE